jgi:hypothetical protein
MTPPSDSLYNLVPAIYRLQDAARGSPLQQLLEVIDEQVAVVRSNIAQLYDDWFIETCEDWVVPYIADLVEYQVVHEAGEPGPQTTAEGRRLDAVLVTRRDVANTIRNRRRKGTLALLDLLAADVAGWPARAVEFDRLTAQTQYIPFPHLRRGRLVDVRRGEDLDLLGGPFDRVAHSPDVRRPDSHRSRGQYNLPSVGLFIWRLEPYSVTRAPAHCIDHVRHHYTFSVLGNDAPLFTSPIAGPPAPPHIADRLNVPAPIRRLAFRDRTADYYGPVSVATPTPPAAVADPADCGPETVGAGKSLTIWKDGFGEGNAVPVADIVAADLSQWAYKPQGKQVAVDPVLGRIAFSPRAMPRKGVWVSYHYGFSADMGGGEYERNLLPVGDRRIYTVAQLPPDAHGPKAGSGPDGEWFPTISEALKQWSIDKKGDNPPRDAVIEIADGGFYNESIEILLDPDDRLEVRAADGMRPVIRLSESYTNRPNALRIARDGDPPEQRRGGRVRLDGLLIAGRGLVIEGELDLVVIRHCTLVPGWSIDAECCPHSGGEPSVELFDTTARLVVGRSILGPVEVNDSRARSDPAPIEIHDSILDATDPSAKAIHSPDCAVAHATVRIVRCTVFGRVHVHELVLAENTLFVGEVKVARRQVGCVRFCYVPRGSVTPRRYECQPDLALAALASSAAGSAVSDADKNQAASAVRPVFNSTRYGRPDYSQLADVCPTAISHGADDLSEMGAFHDLFQPQREANLLARLAEFTPAGFDAGLFYAT